jgi:hypothetical protein
VRPLRYLLIAASIASCLAVLALAPAGSVAGDREPVPALGRTAEPWPGAWAHRVRLTVPTSSLDGAGTLTDFPVVVTLTAGQQFILDGAKPDGSDILITKADGVSPLSREIVTFDPASHEAEIWFRAEVLSAAQNEFFLYYGNPGVNQDDSDGTVWDDTFVAVYHFSENPGAGILRDFTANGNDATAGYQSVWTSSDVTAGIIGQAWDFDGVTHTIRADAISTSDSSFVISSWTKLTTRSTDFAFQANPGFWHVSYQTNESVWRPHYQIANPLRDLRWTPNPLPLDDQFHLFQWVFDGVADTIYFYFDGIQQPATAHYLQAPATKFYTGSPVNPSGTEGVGIAGPMSLNTYDILHGSSDEFRFRVGGQSADWNLIEYRNQSDPQGFLEFGPEETNSSVPVRLLAFRADRVDGGVHLAWTISSDEASDPEFGLYREAGDGIRVRVAGEPVQDGFAFSMIDGNAPSGAILYRLAERSRSGEVSWLGQVQVEGTGVPVLGLAVQNPLPAVSTIRYSTSAAGPVRIQVFNVSGGEVDRIVDADVPAGDHEVRWEARTRSGSPLPPGMYFVRLAAGDGLLTRKVILLR